MMRKKYTFDFFIETFGDKFIFNESTPDPYGLKGNIFYQIKSMEYGLANLPKEFSCLKVVQIFTLNQKH